MADDPKMEAEIIARLDRIEMLLERFVMRQPLGYSLKKLCEHCGGTTREPLRKGTTGWPGPPGSCKACGRRRDYGIR